MRTICEGTGTGLLQHGDDVAQRLLGLRDEVVGLELLLGVPADLATDEDLRAARRHTVGISLGGQPIRAVAGTSCLSLSLKRCSLPVSVRGRLATNSISRGYL
jgi:hypothetical protein